MFIGFSDVGIETAKVGYAGKELHWILVQEKLTLFIQRKELIDEITPDKIAHPSSWATVVVPISPELATINDVEENNQE